ncbi:hypothetical protein D3C78_1981520 [compost metagenome]
MGEGDPRRLFVEDRQRLPIESGAAGGFGDGTGLADQRVEFLVAPTRLVFP